MNSQEFFWISCAIGVAIAILFLRPNRMRDPSRLKMSRERSRVPAAQKSTSMSAESREASVEGQRVKSLNVIFNYNGHSWDAHEVLGVPAGAPINMVKQGFQESIKNADPDSHDFIKTAFEAIQIEYKTR